MRETKSSRRAVFLKAEALEAALADELRAEGHTRIAGPALAGRLGVAYSTYWRQTLPAGGGKGKDRRRQTPSPEFLAAVLHHFREHDNPFAEFFEVHGADEPVAA